jgi:predicted DNA-binding transcriptional regulator AlpA
MDLELLDAKDVRQMLKVSLPLVYKLADQGRLPCVRIPCPGKGTKKRQNLVRFKLADVMQFVERYYRNS